MEKYSKAVSEMYSQFELREADPMEKYVGRHVIYQGQTREVVGYSYKGLFNGPVLIIEGSQTDGWVVLESFDVIFKECESYWYAGINDLIE